MPVSRIVSDDTLSRIIQIESSGKPKAKAPTSSATGLGQFISSTWLDMVKRHRPDLMEGRSQAQVLALRTDPGIAIELLARFTEENAKALGRGYEPGDLYLAHFLGVTAAKALLRASPATPVASLVSASAIRANRSILSGKTAGQVRAWAASRMAASGRVNWVDRFMGAGKTISPVPIADGPTVETAPVPVPSPKKRSWWQTLWQRDPAPVELNQERPIGMHPDGDLLVWKIQDRLAALGYAEVGVRDGLMGPKLSAAVAAFCVENGLPVKTAIDDKLLAALMKAPQRQLSKERVEATADDLRDRGSPLVKHLDEMGWLGKALGLGGVVTAIDQTGVISKVTDTMESIQGTAAMVAKLIGGLMSAIQWIAQHYWLIGLFVGLWIIYKATVGILNVVVLFRQGILQRAKV